MHLTKEHPLFVRAELVNKSFDFFSKEDELKYEENKKRIGSSWEYANKKVSFKFNKSGYRCPVNYDELKDGFLLTMGCSYTEGIGLAEEDTYTYRLAKKLNLIDNYYNAGIGGFGVDVVFWNSLLFSSWCKKNNIIPKYVVIQLTYGTRHSFWYDHDKGIHDEGPQIDMVHLKNEANKDSKREFPYWINNEYYLNGWVQYPINRINNEVFYPQAIHNAWSNLGSKVVLWTWNNPYDTPDLEYNKYLDRVNVEIKRPVSLEEDKAQDLMHNGTKDQIFITNKLVEWLT
jgi:hypothetical protein